MIEVPIDCVSPGDSLGKYHVFRVYELGMSCTVDLEHGDCLTDRVIRRVMYEYRVRYVCIEDPSIGVKDLHRYGTGSFKILSNAFSGCSRTTCICRSIQL
jgi:hypothetical protein